MLDVRVNIRQKFQSDALRRDDHDKMWFRRGTGTPCNACDLPIAESEMEIDADFSDGQTLWFHNHCFRMWETAREVATA